jgi:hypothetical protein
VTRHEWRHARCWPAVAYADGISRAVSRFQQNLGQGLDPRDPVRALDRAVRASVHTQAGDAARSFSLVASGRIFSLHRRSISVSPLTIAIRPHVRLHSTQEGLLV